MTAKPTYEELASRVEELRKIAFEKDSIIDQLGPIFNYSLDLIGSGNLQGYFTKVNPSFVRILGYSEDEILQAPFIDFVHPEDKEATLKALGNAASGQREIYIINRYTAKDGSYKWIDWRVQAFATDNLFIAVGRDVTEQKRLENLLYLNERRFRNIIQTANDGFLQTDDQGMITDCNSAYLRMSGFTRDELLGKHLSDIEALETPAETAEHIRELIKAGQGHFESSHKRKDGGSFDVEITTTFVPQENIFVSFIKNITQRNLFLATIRESEERFRELAENVQEVFWLGSLDWQEIYYISPAYKTIWGKECQHLYNHPLSWLDSIHEQDREKVWKAIPPTIDDTTQNIIFPQYRIIHTNGNIRWISARAFPIRDQEGKIYRIAGIAEDITDRKLDELERERLVRELQIALEKVKTLSGFLPVCASCKKIRNEEDNWELIESYIQRHSEAEITHSICPLCALKLYPDYFEAIEEKKKKE